jgi:hypothetical protein
MAKKKNVADPLAAVQRRGEALRNVPETLRTAELCLAAIGQNVEAFEDVPETLRNSALRW